MKRIRCEACGKYLLSFHGHYLHPELPCNGITDSIDIEATIRDEELNKKFVEMYGIPKISDYELLNKLWHNPIIRFLTRFLK